jgi:hypothetical protein
VRAARLVGAKRYGLSQAPVEAELVADHDPSATHRAARIAE